MCVIRELCENINRDNKPNVEQAKVKWWQQNAGVSKFMFHGYGFFDDCMLLWRIHVLYYDYDIYGDVPWKLTIVWYKSRDKFCIKPKVGIVTPK